MGAVSGEIRAKKETDLRTHMPFYSFKRFLYHGVHAGIVGGVSQ